MSIVEIISVVIIISLMAAAVIGLIESFKER